ncbi:hypothetical protein ABEB36_012239 [Hypothenemus hampei]
MTEKQFEAAVKLVRNMCIGKTKVNPGEIDKMHNGNWDVDNNAQCYMWCSFNSYKLMRKDNHLDKKSVETQLALLPENLHDYVVNCVEKCENAPQNYEDKCVAAYEYAKCMYFYDPEKYFLP